MKIRLSELRRIIRDVLKEQSGGPPGHWFPQTANPLSDDEAAAMGTGGLGIPEDEDELSENFPRLREAKKKKKACSGCSGKEPEGLWCKICRKRAAGKPPAKPGEKGYPKTLDIDENENTNQ